MDLEVMNLDELQSLCQEVGVDPLPRLIPLRVFALAEHLQILPLGLPTEQGLLARVAELNVGRQEKEKIAVSDRQLVSLGKSPTEEELVGLLGPIVASRFAPDKEIPAHVVRMMSTDDLRARAHYHGVAHAIVEKMSRKALEAKFAPPAPQVPQASKKAAAWKPGKPVLALADFNTVLWTDGTWVYEFDEQTRGERIMRPLGRCPKGLQLATIEKPKKPEKESAPGKGLLARVGIGKKEPEGGSTGEGQDAAAPAGAPA